MKSKYNVISIAIIYLIATSGLSSQNLFPDYPPIYKDDIVARIDITLPADSLAIILAPGNELSDYHFHATFVFDNGIIRDTFEDIGFRLRGNTSRFSAKKSFKVSLNTYVPGRKWYGVEKLNLNGEHNDPTVSRSKMSWDLLRDIGVPASRSNHAELYINGTYYGLYASVEHIDEEFVQTRFGNNDGNLYKCLYPADLNYLGSDPNLYKLTSGDRRVYELKTNEEEDDYSDLAHFIDVLNNTPTQDLPCELEKVFNVNTFLKSIAYDILSGNWDGPHYNKNNFYLYHNISTGLFEYIPYDLDNTFGIDWFAINWAERNIYSWGHPTESRPLFWRVIQIPAYKNRLSYYMKMIVDEVYKESVMFTKADGLKILLAPSIEDDEFYTMDYGFTIHDFNNGFSQDLPYFHTPVGIKQFIATRRSATLDQLQLFAIPPIITDVTDNVFAGQLSILATIEDDTGVNGVTVLFEWNKDGQMMHADMYDDGQHLDGEPGDGRYGILIPIPNSPSSIEYNILASDLHFDLSFFPVCGSRELITSLPSATLVVNELMADNETTIADSHDDYEDWVEIYNYGNEGVYLGDFYLSDKEDNPTKWQFPDTSIEAGAYMLIWADEEGDEGPLHADIKLSAGGEFVGIFDSDANGNVLIDGVAFGPQEPDISFGRLPNGTGPFIALQPTPGSMNLGTSSTNEERDAIQYLIYPNPASDVLYVQSNHSSSIKQIVVVMNVLGQVVIEKVWEENLLFDISGLPDGVYVVGVKGELGARILGKVLHLQE